MHGNRIMYHDTKKLVFTKARRFARFINFATIILVRFYAIKRA